PSPSVSLLSFPDSSPTALAPLSLHDALPISRVSVRDSEMVFVGYGVDAPERGWNDYAGQDWTGKTVVMFVNDPGFHSNDEKLFRSESTRLNSSHVKISYAVFCLKKKKKQVTL